MRKQPAAKILGIMISIILLTPNVVLAVPVSYKGQLNYAGTTPSTHILKAESVTGTTEKEINVESSLQSFLLNHLANEGESITFYFDNIEVKTYTQTKPGSVVDLEEIVVPGQVTVEKNEPNVEAVDITELENQIFSISVSDSRGATIFDYYWYKDGIEVSNEDTYTFAGDNTNKGSNAGDYVIKGKACNKAGSCDTTSWDLSVERVQDTDSDGIPDSFYDVTCTGGETENCNDNCPYRPNPDQDDICSTDFDGDGVDDDEDTVIGDESHITTNVENIALSIGTYSDVSGESITGEKKVKLSVGAEDIVEFDFNFDEENLELKLMTVKKQEAGESKGSIVVKGLDLTSQGKTKTVYIDNLDDESNAVCIKDAEIASVKEISDSCDSADEFLISCDGTEQDGYTCTEFGDTKYKIEGLKHSGIVQDYKEEEEQGGGGGGGAGGGGGGGGGGAVSAVAVKLTNYLTEIEQSAESSSKYTVDVQNSGTSDGTFSISIDGIPDSYYTASDPIRLRGLGTTEQRSGKLSYTLILPADATDDEFTVTITGEGVNTATKSYTVSLTVTESLAPEVTTEVIRETLPPGNVILNTTPFTGAVTAASENNIVRGVVGAIAIFAVVAVILRNTVRKSRTPWKSNYYKDNRKTDVVGKMKKMKKKFFNEEKWVGKI